MLNKLLKKNTFQITKEYILQEESEHEWIRNDKSIYRFFKDLYSTLSDDDFNKLYKSKNKKILFIFSDGKFATTLHKSENDCIIIYPELLNLIRSVDYSQALAILFHEIGHIYHDHRNKNISNLDKQIEADHFACVYGLDQEILELLKSSVRTLEVVERIKAINNYLGN